MYLNSFLGFGEAAEQEGDHGQIGEAFAVVGALLVVPGQVPPLHQSGQGALDHPAPRQPAYPFCPWVRRTISKVNARSG